MEACARGERRSNNWRLVKEGEGRSNNWRLVKGGGG